jgi:hypothetical protein
MKHLYVFLKFVLQKEWRVTHVAQNTRYEVSGIDKFVVYVKKQIVSGNFGPFEIVNIDEANIEFEMICSITLADQGSRTVSFRSTVSSSHSPFYLESLYQVKSYPHLLFSRENQMDKLLVNGLALQSTQALQFMQYK